MHRVKGLDPIRICAAFIVYLSHTAFYAVSDNLKHIYIFRLLDYALKAIIPNGPAAVVVFFVISGFVIHFPYAKGDKKISIPEFYLKRILRIAIPLFVAYLIYYFLRTDLAVNWSIWCEIWYYLAYPIVLYYRKHLVKIIIITTIISLSMSIYRFLNYPYDGDLWVWGIGRAWLVCFPFWLIGVKLAETYTSKVKKENDVQMKQLILWRVGMYFFGSVLLLIHFHLHIPYYFSMFPFAICTYFWLQKEMLYYNEGNHVENKYLAYAGMFSYSVYLMGEANKFLFIKYIDKYFNTNLIYCILSYISLLIVGYIFYICVEKPSHRFSKAIRLKKIDK